MAYTPEDEFLLDAEDRMERKFEREPLGIAQNPRNEDVDWRIYYVDHTKPNGYYTVSNIECDPADVPINDVICILQYLEEAAIVLGEYYSINGEGVWDSGESGDLSGYWVDYETHSSIMVMALFDTDFYDRAYSNVPSSEFALNTEEKMERVFNPTPSGFAPNPRNPNVLWKIYYEDGIIVSNIDYPTPADAPSEDVICILQYMNDQEVDVVYNIDYEDDDEAVVRGDVFFINEYGRWQGGFNDDTLADRDARGIAYSTVKNGYVADTDICAAVITTAGLDTEFPTGINFEE